METLDWLETWLHGCWLHGQGSMQGRDAYPCYDALKALRREKRRRDDDAADREQEAPQ
ncbi:hypothetical protein [Paraburkholderia atlantica]|uniref:hypothetical protein n=1 Tax=Paraburkholderia atlantica TaxID=2654982 RepID=UPI003D23EF62